MKMIKKLATLLLAVCLLIPCFSIVSFAADGKIMFTDPSTKVGETLEVKGVIQKSSGTMGKIEILMSYDTDYLKFKEGAGVTESASGKLTYVGDATRETGSRKEFTLKFTVLKEGTTKLTVQSSTIKNTAGTVMNYTNGSSTITIAAGEGTADVDTNVDVPDNTTGDANIEISGEYYTISNNIPEDKIPKGYEKNTLEYDMVDYQVVYSENFGVSLAYLIGTSGNGDFFMYVEEDATFVPYREVEISDSVRIALLSDVSDIALPSQFKATKVSLKGVDFPAWRNSEKEDFCILYALNSNGEKALYQFDSAEGTYQRFEAPQATDEKKDSSFVGKLSDLLENHLDKVILGTGLGFIIFVIIIVILSVKLYNRNAELDEIYDEYGIDLEDEEENTDDDDDEYDDDEEDVNDNKDMELLVQAGMMEVFADEVEEVQEDFVELKIEEPVKEQEEPVETVTANTVEIPIEKVVEQVVSDEDTLGTALAKQQEAMKEEQEEFFDDDDDILDNFSMDFIDLDD